MTAATPLSRLGELTVRQFLRRHWQRQPLLLRQALPDLPEGITTRVVFALARDPDVESRLVVAPQEIARPQTERAASASHGDPAWKLRHGPFPRLPPRSRPGWTLLVQGVDLHLPQARTLMDRFRFIPDARLDDLMISYATDGGGVGPHVDSYDVFLLQLQGRRRWRIRPPGPARLVPDAPIKVLADFRSQQSWLLEPGDMLYLPPGWAHEGTAVGECMTCSIGFRSPTAAQLRQAFHAFLADNPPPVDERTHRYRDRTIVPTTRPAEIPPDMAQTLGGWLKQQPSRRLIERFLGCYLTEPKPSVWFEPPQPLVPLMPSADQAAPALTLDRRTRMLYRGGACYLNGEAVEMAEADRASRTLLRTLADRRGLDAVQTARALRLPWLRDRLDDWLASGWLRRAGS